MDISKADPAFLLSTLGKMGGVLHAFANGQDNSPVTHHGTEGIIKSIRNSTTTPKDMTCDHDLKITCLVSCESVAARLRESLMRWETRKIVLSKSS